MKDDVDDAFIRLLGKDDFFEFTFGTKQGTIVDGVKKNSRPGYNSDLCLRIDIQDTFTETVGGKKMEIANIQIQLNQKIRPSTIAQVHFQCGVKIPGDVIKRAFEKSWTEKKIIYVYRNVWSSNQHCGDEDYGSRTGLRDIATLWTLILYLLLIY